MILNWKTDEQYKIITEMDGVMINNITIHSARKKIKSGIQNAFLFENGKFLWSYVAIPARCRRPEPLAKV